MKINPYEEKNNSQSTYDTHPQQELVEALKAKFDEQQDVINSLSAQLQELATFVRQALVNPSNPVKPLPRNEPAPATFQNSANQIKIPMPDKWSGPKDHVNAKAWVFTTKNYLNHHGLYHDPLGLPIVIALLIGPASTWVQSQTNRNGRFENPKALLDAVELWAEPPYTIRRHRDQLAALKQHGSVQEYINAFQTVCLHIPSLAEDEMFERFQAGLKPQIRIEVLKVTMNNLELAFKTALLQEGISTPWSQRNHTNRNFTQDRHQDQGSPMDLDAVDSQGGLIKLTNSQRSYLIQNNGCFKCRKINVDHVASNCPVRSQPRPRTSDNNAIEIAEIETRSAETESERYLEINAVNLSVKTPVNTKETPSFSINSLSPHHLPPSKPTIDKNDWMLNPNVASLLFEQWGTPTVDLFASAKNKQAEFYYRTPSDLPYGEGCLGDDSFACTWNFKELAYANPPWEMAERVIQKIKKDETAQIILILPFTNKVLRHMSVRDPIRLKHSPDLFIPPGKQGMNQGGIGMPHWRESWAFLVSGAKQATIVPRSTATDSRFLFTAQVGSKPCIALADSGCTSMIVSADFVDRHNLITRKIPPQSFTFANRTTHEATQGLTIKFSCKTYTRDIDFFVCAVKQDVILGTPWFETIKVDNLDWRFRSFGFRDLATQSDHTWTAIGKPKSPIVQRIRRVAYNNPSELTRNTEWVASIALNAVLDSKGGIDICATDVQIPQDRGMYNYAQAQTTVTEPKPVVNTSMIDQLLNKYQSVFEEPITLPPNRVDNHEINLLADSKIPPWRPIYN
jgi:hypothetical protein